MPDWSDYWKKHKADRHHTGINIPTKLRFWTHQPSCMQMVPSRFSSYSSYSTYSTHVAFWHETPGVQLKTFWTALTRTLTRALTIALSGAFLNMSLTPALSCALFQSLNSKCLLNCTPGPHSSAAGSHASPKLRPPPEELDPELPVQRTWEMIIFP